MRGGKKEEGRLEEKMDSLVVIVAIGYRELPEGGRLLKKKEEEDEEEEEEEDKEKMEG